MTRCEKTRFLMPLSIVLLILCWPQTTFSQGPSNSAANPADEEHSVNGQHPIAAEVEKQLKDYKGAFTLAVTLKSKPGKSVDLVRAYRTAAVKTHAEKGNLQYVLNRSFGNENEFMLFEQWKSIEDLDKHLKQPYLVAMLKELEDVLSESPKLQAMEFEFNKLETLPQIINQPRR